MATRNWYEKILRIEPGISLAQWAWERFTGNWHWIAAVTGGGAMTYFAQVTDWLEVWGPVAWGAIGISAFLGILLSIGLFRFLSANAQLKRATAREITGWRHSTDHVNPLDSDFNKKRLRLEELAHPISRKISGKSFTDCELLGPATVFFASGNLYGVKFNDINVIPIREGVRLNVLSVIILEDCDIVRGSVWGCNFLIPPRLYRNFTDMGAPFVGFTGDPNFDSQEPPNRQA